MGKVINLIDKLMSTSSANFVEDGIFIPKKIIKKDNKIFKAIEEIPFKSSNNLISDVEEELKRSYSFIEKLNHYLEIENSHILNLKRLIQFDTPKQLTLMDTIVLILINEKKELHRNEIYDKVKLFKGIVKKDVFTTSLNYLLRKKKIFHGKERGYWKSTE